MNEREAIKNQIEPEADPHWLDTGKPTIVIFLVALLVRLAYLFEASGEPWFGAPVLDSQYVVNQARYIVQHGELPPGPFFRPPFYTWYLVAIVAVASDLVMFFAPLLQYLLGAGFCVLLFGITRACWSAGAGFIAGMVAALYSPLVFFETEVLSDTMALFFYTAFLAAWIRARSVGSWKTYAAAGALAGLGCITRPNLIVCVVAFVTLAVLIDLLRARRTDASFSLRNLLPTMGAFLLPVIILTGIPSFMNWQRGDFNFIASQGGVNFWIGNHERSNGTNITIPYGIEIPGEEYRDMIEEVGILFYWQEQHGSREGFRKYHEERRNPPRPSMLSKYWYARGQKWLRENPANAVRLYMRKTIALFADYEIRNNRQFTFMREHISTVLKLVPFSMGYIVAGALGGWVAVIVALARRRNFGSEAVLWVVVYTGIAAATIIMFFVAGRLRLSVLPGLFVLTGIGAMELIAAIRSRRWAPATLLTVAMATGALLSFSKWRSVDFRYMADQPEGLGLEVTSNFAMEWTMLAKPALAKGKAQDALEYAKRALEVQPDFPYAGLIIGDAALMLGDVDTAGQGYRLAHTYEPNSCKALNNLAVVAERYNDFEAAASIYQHSLRTNGFHAPSLGNYSILLARTGRTTEALELASRALIIDPGNRAARAVREELAGAAPAADDEVKQLREEIRQPLPPVKAIGQPQPLREAVNQAAPAAS